MNRLNEVTEGWFSVIIIGMVGAIIIYFSLSCIFKNKGRYFPDIVTILIGALIIIYGIFFVGGWQTLGIMMTTGCGILTSLIFTLIKVIRKKVT
ncbi:hypothetical protein [Salibacterium sp. K-3]